MVSARLIVILLVTLSACAVAQTGRPANSANDEADILRSITEISDAYVARNPEPFERIYLENYISIRGRPVYNTRDQLIAMMKADSILLRVGKKLDYETLSYDGENPQFHFYGPNAIVNITKKNFWQYHGSKCLTRTQGTELWIKRDGAWHAAASHVSTFQCDAMPFYPIHPAVAAIPSNTKAPPSGDPEAEAQIRAVINETLNLRASDPDGAASAIAKYTVKDFIATTAAGDVIHDRSILSSLPPIAPSRMPGLRNQDDAIAVYDDVALYTFKVRRAAPAPGMPPDPPQQCTLILVRSQGAWLIAAAHISKYGSD